MRKDRKYISLASLILTKLEIENSGVSGNADVWELAGNTQDKQLRCYLGKRNVSFSKKLQHWWASWVLVTAREARASCPARLRTGPCVPVELADDSLLREL